MTREEKQKFDESYDRIFPPGRKKPANGTYIFKDGRLIQGVVRKNDAHNMESVAAGVIPEQIPQWKQMVRDKGISGVTVKPDGNLVFADTTARKRYLKTVGLVDLNG